VKYELTWCVTHSETVLVLVIHTIFGMWHSNILWTCMWMWAVLYQLYMITRNCTRFHETQESQRSKAWGQLILTCNAMECGRAREMMPLVKWFLHIELGIPAKPELVPPVKYVQHTGKIDLAERVTHTEAVHWLVIDSIFDLWHNNNLCACAWMLIVW